MKRYCGIVFAAVLAVGILAAWAARFDSPPVAPLVWQVVASDAPAHMRIGLEGRWLCGSTGCNVQIQAANDAIVASPGEGVIQCSPGAFAIAATVTLGDNVTLEGAGMGLTVLTSINALNEPMLINTDFDEDDSLNSNITVRGITFDADRDNQNSTAGGGRWVYTANGGSGTLCFNEVNDLTIVDCEVLNASRAGMCINQSNEVRVLNCQVDNCEDDAVAIDDACAGAVVSGCTLTEVGKSNVYGAPHGIEVQDAAHDVSVVGNYISCATTYSGNEPAGIGLRTHSTYNGPYDVTIIGNTILNGVAGVYLRGEPGEAASYPRDVTISGNAIRCDDDCNLRNVGVRVDHGYRVTITGNVYRKDEADNTGSFVTLGIVEDIVISGNQATVLSGGSNASDDAIYPASAITSSWKRVSIQGNTFTDWDHGYFLIGNTDSVIEELVIRGNTLTSPNVATSYAFFWDDDGSSTFTNCVVGKQYIGESLTHNHYLYAGSNFGGSGWTTTSVGYAIADEETGAQATATLTPSTEVVEITCNDAHGADVTMGETGIPDGFEVTIINLGANVLDFADTGGVSELAGAITLGQYDQLRLRHVGNGAGGYWVELSRSNN